MDAFARVLAEPGSIAARVALAEAWRAAGNPQAELIEKQLAYRELALANKTASAPAKALEGAIDMLIERHGAAWAGRIAQLVDDYRYRRGLVAQVRLSADKFMATADELFALAPIQHVSLEGPIAPAVLESPHLGKLASLAIERQWDAFGDREAIALAGSRHVSGLRWLSLYANHIGEAGVEALAASPYLEKCVYLGLTENPCNPTPVVNDFDGQFVVERPSIAERLEKTYGVRPWLTGPPEGLGWPPDRDAVAVVP